MKHTGENPYKCNVCDYSTPRHNDLRLHMMKHTGENLTSVMYVTIALNVIMISDYI